MSREQYNCELRFPELKPPVNLRSAAGGRNPYKTTLKYYRTDSQREKNKYETSSIEVWIAPAATSFTFGSLRRGRSRMNSIETLSFDF